MNEPQELHCHNCDKYVRFNLDLSIDGNYLLECPDCGHKHYRIVKNGKITDLRWGRDPSQLSWTQVYAVSSSSTSSYASYGNTVDTSVFFHNAWASSTSTTIY